MECSVLAYITVSYTTGRQSFNKLKQFDIVVNFHVYQVSEFMGRLFWVVTLKLRKYFITEMFFKFDFTINEAFFLQTSDLHAELLD